MKEVTKYVAFDGTQFETEAKCDNYEWQLRGVRKRDYEAIVMYSVNADLVYDNASVDDVYDFVKVNTKNEANIINAVCNLTGYLKITKKDVGTIVVVYRDTSYNFHGTETARSIKREMVNKYGRKFVKLIETLKEVAA